MAEFHDKKCYFCSKICQVVNPQLDVICTSAACRKRMARVTMPDWLLKRRSQIHGLKWKDPKTHRTPPKIKRPYEY